MFLKIYIGEVNLKLYTYELWERFNVSVESIKSLTYNPEF